MYAVFQAKHPDIADHCGLTTFLSLRPWWIVSPTHREFALLFVLLMLEGTVEKVVGFCIYFIGLMERPSTVFLCLGFDFIQVRASAPTTTG
jgi:hypothetical protein